MRALWLLAALLAAGCGGGTDGTPVAPPTTPAPAPAPPPEPPPEPRVCTDELERAKSFLNSALPREWDGTPFRFDLFDNYPEVPGGDYAERQLEMARELAAQIEEQIGYPVYEAGGVVPVREGLPDGWDTPSHSGPKDCHLWREPGQILAFHLASLPEGHQGGGALGAVPWCAILNHYVGEGSTTDPNSAWGRSGIVHELFHLLGFGHNDETHPHEVHLGGVFMSKNLTNGDNFTQAFMAPTFEDIDALRCVFPKGG